MKKTAFTVMMILASALILQTGCKSMSTESLKGSIEVIDVETTWVSKYFQPLASAPHPRAQAVLPDQEYRRQAS